ncbi:MAG: DUF721 domain-containing protein [Candidatus Doudnabacteria bacterium]|nr:DUF721 domain-containing protein [Candidatus Doudnabacteria bacterium]
MNKRFVKISTVLKSAQKNYQLEEAVYKHKLLKIWSDIVEAFVMQGGRYTKAIDFKKGVLTVASLSTEAAYQVKVLAAKIIEALNEVLGTRTVYAIRIEL